MIPWVELGRTPVPGGGEFRLMQRGAEYWIMTGTTALMNSRMSGSEEALATLSLARLTGLKAPELLIGGLGMGFTLRAALAARAEVKITVAELVPGVIEWARGPLAPIFAGSMEDPRVTVIAGDVGALMRRAPKAYDGILLDVDNGPEGLSRDANDGLYTVKGLRIAHAALRPGGVLAVWSSHPDAKFTDRLRAGGFVVEDLKVRANGPRGGARHTIWIASRAGR